jgi:hypothetical protein
MNELSPVPYAEVHKANVAMVYGLANLMFEGVQTFAQLNLRAAHAALEQTQAVLLAADPRAAALAQAGANSPLTDELQTYWRGVYTWTASAQGRLTALAIERFEARNRHWQALFEDMSKQAPAGSQAAVDALKKVLDSGNAFYESVHKTVRQAAQLAEGGVEAMLPRAPDALTR